MDQVIAYIEMGLAIVGAAAVVASLTPTTTDDSFLAKARSVLNWLAFNIGQAKNKD